MSVYRTAVTTSGLILLASLISSNASQQASVLKDFACSRINFGTADCLLCLLHVLQQQLSPWQVACAGWRKQHAPHGPRAGSRLGRAQRRSETVYGWRSLALQENGKDNLPPMILKHSVMFSQAKFTSLLLRIFFDWIAMLRCQCQTQSKLP